MTRDELDAIKARRPDVVEWEYWTMPEPKVVGQMAADHDRLLSEVERLREILFVLTRAIESGDGSMNDDCIHEARSAMDA